MRLWWHLAQDLALGAGEGADASKIKFLMLQPFESFLESRISSQFDILMTRKGTLIKQFFFPVILDNLNLRKRQTNVKRKTIVNVSAQYLAALSFNAFLGN